MDKNWDATKARFIKNHGRGTWMDIQRLKQAISPGDLLDVWCDEDGLPSLSTGKRYEGQIEIIEKYPNIVTVKTGKAVFDLDYPKLYLTLMETETDS